MSNSRIPLVPALEVLTAWRTDEVIISAMGAAREWLKFPEHPLDLVYLPSAMGQPPSLGLGLALAQPSRHVVVLVGDGSLLMNLGSLVTVAASKAENLTLVLLDNGVYEVTGNQSTAAAKTLTDFCGLARAAAIPTVVAFDSLEAWREGITAAMRLPGPRLIKLLTEPVRDNPHLPVPSPIVERIARLRNNLHVTGISSTK